MIDSIEPPDPFVPSGRELDEGVTGPGLVKPKKDRPGVVERMLEKLHRHSGKNHTEIVIEADDAVMASPPGVREREPGEDDAGSTQQSGSANPPEQTNPSPDPAPRFVPEPEFVASVVALCRTSTPADSSLWEELLGAVALADTSRDLLNWWLKADEPTPETLSAQTRSSLPDDVLTVLDHVTHEAEGPHRLTSYRRACAAWDEYDQSVRALNRKARDYPSLEALVEAVKEGDIAAAQQRIDYDSAAWHDCRLVVSHAMSALQAARQLGTRPAMVRFPRQTAAAPIIEQAVISTICTPSSVEATLDASQERLAATDVPDSAPAVQDLVSRLLKP